MFSRLNQMDDAVERVVNVVYYFFMFVIILAMFQIDPWAAISAITGFVLTFSFMFKTTCSNMFLGSVYVLVQRPYGVGDNINVNAAYNTTVNTGSSVWTVTDIDLLKTTMMYTTTCETASVSNYILAGYRVINQARSPQANIYFNLYLPIHSPYKKIRILGDALERFVKERPNEVRLYSASFLCFATLRSCATHSSTPLLQFLRFNAFQAMQVQANLGYVEYFISVKHRGE